MDRQEKKPDQKLTDEEEMKRNYQMMLELEEIEMALEMRIVPQPKAPATGGKASQ